MNDTIKLEDNPVWKLAHKISIYMLEILDKYKEDLYYPIDFKLRDAAVTIATTTAAAIGSIDPRDKIWSFGKARGNAFEIKGIYKILHDSKIITIVPEIMLHLDAVVELFDQEIKTEYGNLQKWYKDMGSVQDVTA